MSEQDEFPEHSPVGGAESAPDPLLDRVLVGKFRLEKLLGVGAMGRVYRAEHLSLSQKIAVKVLHEHLTGDESLARRFHREAKSAFTLNHPNSITIMDFGQDDDLLYIAMELLEGRSLHDVIHEDGPLDLERTVRILDQVCLALDEAHHQKIVHRDLKPENIMVQHRRGEPDFVKVCDFGIAKVQDASGESAITMAGMVCGTPEYMSPEQARGEPLDGRSDLYSLAVILYQMVTARLPFTAETALGCVTKHLTEQPPKPSDLRPDLDIPPILEELILRGLAKDPDQRPPSVAAFRQELTRLAERVGRGETDAPASAAPATGDTAPAAGEAPEVAARRTGGARWALPAGLGILGILAVAAVAWLVLGRGAGSDRTGSARRAGAAQASGRTADVGGPASGAALDAVPAPSATDAAAAVADAAGDAPDDAPDSRLAVAAAAAAPASRRHHVARRAPPRLRRRQIRRRRARARRVRPRRGAPRDRHRERLRERPRERPPASGFDGEYRAARAAWSSGAYATALKHFRAALRKKPSHAPSLKYVAQCYLRLGRPCAALRWFKRYQRLRPGDFFVKQHVKTLSAKCGG